MNGVPLTSNELAFDRTVMALERTLMAWIRTSLSLISFGFTIYKFLQALGANGAVAIRENAPRNLGLFLIIIGMGSLTMAIFQFKGAMATITSGMDVKLPRSLSLMVAFGVLVVGAVALMNIFFGFGGF